VIVFFDWLFGKRDEPEKQEQANTAIRSVHDGHEKLLSDIRKFKRSARKKNVIIELTEIIEPGRK